MDSESLSLKHLKNCSKLVRNNPCLNLHFQKEIHAIQQHKKNEKKRICPRCCCYFRKFPPESLLLSIAKQKKRLKILCSLCSSEINKIPFLPKEKEKKQVTPPANAIIAPKMEQPKKKKNKDINAGLIIPTGFSKSKPKMKKNTLLELLDKSEKEDKADSVNKLKQFLSA